MSPVLWDVENVSRSLHTLHSHWPTTGTVSSVPVPHMTEHKVGVTGGPEEPSLESIHKSIEGVAMEVWWGARPPWANDELLETNRERRRRGGREERSIARQLWMAVQYLSIEYVQRILRVLLLETVDEVPEGSA